MGIAQANFEWIGAIPAMILAALVLLTFGGADRARVKDWMHVIDALRAAEKPKRRSSR